MFILCKKSHLPLTSFLKLVIFGTLACLSTPIINYSTTLQETVVLIHKQKINLTPQFVLETLQFKESYDLIGQEHFGQ